MNNKISFNICSFLMVYALLVTPLAYTHTLSFTNNLTFIIYLFGFYCIGAALLAPVALSKSLIPVSHTALSMFIGGFVFSMFIFISANPVALLALLLAIIFLILLVYRKHTEWVLMPGKVDAFAFVAALIVIALISFNDAGDISKQFTAVQDGSFCYSNDRYFNTAIVASMRHGSIFNASYEVGSPINYQILGFFIPALLADVLNISSHQALWGLGLPLYKLLVMLLGYELCFYFLKDKVSRSNYWFIILAVALPVLMAPLHPLYLAKGIVRNFIFNGMGYLMPAGTIAYPVTIVLLLLNFLLFVNIDWKNRKFSAGKIFLIIGLSVMVTGKIPVYAAFMIFLYTIVLKRVVIDKEPIMDYFVSFLSPVVLGGILFKVCYGQYPGGRNYFKYGYLPQLFSTWFARPHNGVLNNIVILGLILLLFLLWMGIRLLGLFALYKSKSGRLREVLIGCIVSFTGIFILASFLHMERIDGKGTLLVDGTGDVEQFIRSAFYLATICATIGMLYLIYGSAMKSKFKKAAFLVLGAWCCLTFATSIYNVFTKNESCGPIEWYTDNYSQLKTGKFNDGLIAVNPNHTFFGIMMASSDYGKYWTAMDRSPGNNNCTIKNEYRWALFKNLLDSPKDAYLEQMKNEGVKYIISTPVDSGIMANISHLYPQRIHKVKETNWIFELQ